MCTDPHQDSRRDRRAMANRIDVVCDRFETALRAGEQPVIEAYLQQSRDVDQHVLLKELLALEIEFRREAGGDVDADEYIARFPQAARAVGEAISLSAAATGQFSIAFLPLLLAGRERAGGPMWSEPLVELQRLAGQRVFPPQAPLMRQGEEATSLMVIREGTVEIRVEDDNGRTHVIGGLGPGQVLGEMALLTSEPRTASAVAVEQVRAAVLPVELFHELCGRYPQLSSLLIELIADRLGNSELDALTNKGFDRYHIRRRLGRGGMSVVYEAVDTTNETTVALKMLSHRLVYSPAALRRFQREADLIERFDHPHIVKMYGRFAAFRTYFIAMEFCPGQTLAQFIERHGAMDETTFRRAFRQLASALSHAHDAGIIHRDLKPSNIMRLPTGTFKLMDFGLAEPVAGESPGDGDVVGTPRYMAPEQRAGGIVDERPDYFSLGCVAYEMLTGVPLFRLPMRRELSRDFRNWQPPDFTRLGTPLAKNTARMLQPMLAVDPRERSVDLRAISAWD